MRQACLGRVPRRSSARLAENLRSETRRFFRLEGRRTPPYRCMARDETNQTGKYSVSGTMLPESLCPGLQRRTPCPCSLSDSLRACQKNSYLTRSQGEQHCSPCAQDCQKGLRAAEAAPKAGRRVLLLPRPPSVQPPDIPRGYVRHRGSRSSPGAPGNYSP